MSEPTTAHRRAATALAVLGIALIVLALVLPGILRRTVITYPDEASQDRTVHATGTATLLVDPVKLAPQSPGQPLPLDLQRRVHTLDTVGDTAVVEADDALSIGNLAPQRFVQRYTIDRNTLRNVATASPAFTFAPGSPIDRSPAFSVAFPVSAGAGPYAVWNDETGQPVNYSDVGRTTIDGVAVDRYHGALTDGPLQPALVAQLAPDGLPATATLTQLRPQLAAAGVDVDHFVNAIVPHLDLADQPVVNALLAAPIPLDYRMSLDDQLLVEPWTGTIVAREHVDETISLRPEPIGIGRIYAILTQPKYTGKADVTAAATDLARVLATPPTTKLITLSYAQTAQSSATVAAEAGHWASQIILLTITLPIVVGVGGLLLCLAAAWMLWRRRGIPTETEETP